MQMADKIIMRPVAALIPYARNARTHSEAQVAQIAGSIREFGFTNPIRDPAGAQILADLPGGGARGLASRKREAFEPSRRRAGSPQGSAIKGGPDMHANLYDEIIANATVVTGYRTYPHIDTYETARLAGEILLRTIRGEVNPVMAWGNVPMLPHVMRQGTDDHPNKELQHRCATMTADGALAASLFTGFPHADITNAGLSAVVVTDGE